ncbi:hypothetical protein SAMN06265348_113206 [Pedobacter westerhofensis]|uniref:Uncharacterized protein n=1 Tax=Pedobacter westerhofensis TaxID=425512 RepID=A0A521FNG3_9SPHI|nr:hypothetical protein SAMN06265348_113206 [Pedobacter westerhofensis]
MNKLTSFASVRQDGHKIHHFEERVMAIQQKHYYWFSRQSCPKVGSCQNLLLSHIDYIPDFNDGLEICINETIPSEIRWECQSAFYEIFKPF